MVERIEMASDCQNPLAQCERASERAASSKRMNALRQLSYSWLELFPFVQALQEQPAHATDTDLQLAERFEWDPRFVFRSFPI